MNKKRYQYYKTHIRVQIKNDLFGRDYIFYGVQSAHK